MPVGRGYAPDALMPGTVGDVAPTYGLSFTVGATPVAMGHYRESPSRLASLLQVQHDIARRQYRRTAYHLHHYRLDSPQ